MEEQYGVSIVKLNQLARMAVSMAAQNVFGVVIRVGGRGQIAFRRHTA